jgi:hypothetical protein
VISEKTKTTNKKFYNKWLYKVTLKLNGANMLRSRSLESLKEFCLSEENDHGSYSYASRNWRYREELLEVTEFLLTSTNKEWTKRVENNIVDFYTNDEDFYNDLSNRFEEKLRHRFQPDGKDSNLDDNAFNIIVKELPHKKYKHRVYLLPHKLRGDREAKQKYIDWIKAQSPKITCTTAVQHWFLKTDWNWDRRYVLVDNEQTLLMLKLRNAEVMGRVYNFIISDK